MGEVETDPKDIAVLSEVLTALKRLDKAGQINLLQTAATFLGLVGISLISRHTDSHSSSNEISEEPSSKPTFSADRSLSPKEFMLDKQPRTDVERVACLAYYLAHYANLPHFETHDISKLNTEAAQVKLSNAAYAVNNAVQSGYLVAASHGKKQLSAGGERFVQSLPDRHAARKAMETVRPRRNSKRTSTTSSSES